MTYPGPNTYPGPGTFPGPGPVVTLPEQSPVDDAAEQAYGIDLRLTDDGDLALSNAGGLVAVRGARNCAQALRQRLLTPRGTLPLHEAYGSDLLRRLVGSKAQDAVLTIPYVQAELHTILEQDRRFVSVRDIRVIEHGVQLAIACGLVLSSGEVLQVSDLANPRTDEVAIDLAELSVSDLAGALDHELFAGIDPTDPDYGEPVDFSLLLDNPPPEAPDDNT